MKRVKYEKSCLYCKRKYLTKSPISRYCCPAHKTAAVRERAAACADTSTVTSTDTSTDTKEANITMKKGGQRTVTSSDTSTVKRSGTKWVKWGCERCGQYEISQPKYLRIWLRGEFGYESEQPYFTPLLCNNCIDVWVHLFKYTGHDHFPNIKDFQEFMGKEQCNSFNEVIEYWKEKAKEGRIVPVWMNQFFKT